MTETLSPRKPDSRGPFLAVWCAYSVAMLLGVWLLVFPSGMAERMDFRQLYAGGYLARTDPENLYDFDRQMKVQIDLISHADGLLPFNHPAYEAWLFAPLSRLSYRGAYFCFLCVNLLLLQACFFTGRDIFSRPGIIAQPRPGLQLFAFFPVIVTMLQGQDSVLFLLGLCLVYRFLGSDRGFLAGAALGILIFKPQVAFPVALFLIARYGFSLMAGFVMGGTIVSALSIGLVGWGAFVAMGRVLLLTGSVSVSRNVPSGSMGVYPVVMANLRGVISGLAGGLFPGKVIFALTLALSLWVGLWTIRILRRAHLGCDFALSLSISAAILLSYHLYLHDLSAMQVPLGLMGNSEQPYISKSNILFYLAPPFLLIIAPRFLFLMALPVALFLYGVSRMSLRAPINSEFAKLP